MQATSPFRPADDIDGTIEKCVDCEADSCVSVTEAESSPYWMYALDDKDTLLPLLKLSPEESYQRQKLPKIYQLNGAVYVAKCEYLLREEKLLDMNTLAYVMSAEHSLDIDTMKDFLLAESILEQGIPL